MIPMYNTSSVLYPPTPPPVPPPPHPRSRRPTLTGHPTLVVYGDRDGLTSTKKVRRWVAEMAPGDDDGGDPLFQACEVVGAGRFWREDGVEPALRWAVRRWVLRLSW
ncbi:MAG: hypothetical protein M1826_000057 [Phylliscum demangeonii]|nr:MAG: hypothetical protein M1826_000057 [Phylliscum demangeonii]